MIDLPPMALLRIAELERSIGRKLAAYSPADYRTEGRYNRNAQALEAKARKA